MIKRKGFDYAIRALKFLPDEVVLHLVGDGPLETDLRELANDEGVSARVHMHGFQSREQMRQVEDLYGNGGQGTTWNTKVRVHDIKLSHPVPM